MFYRLLFIVFLLSQFQVRAQHTKHLQLESYQFAWGAVMSSKIPAASYATYSSYMPALFEDTSLVDLSKPYALTTLRLTPNLMAQAYFKNSTSKNLHRFGFSFQNRLISSFALTGIQYPNNDSLPLFKDTADVVVKLVHSSPVYTFDYAWLKEVPVHQRFSLSVGAGAYVGLSGKSKLKGIALFDYWNFTFMQGARSFENIGFAASNYTLNMGVYTSLGFSYCLNAPHAPRQKWYLTYESRFGIDYFAIKNVPSSWLSFQNNQVLGLRYMLAR